MLARGRKYDVWHVHLASRAEIIAVIPASAHALQRLATGACSDLLSLTVAATKAPVVLFPAMNANMWRHRAIARNVAQLRADGCYVVEPGPGFEVSTITPCSCSCSLSGRRAIVPV